MNNSFPYKSTEEFFRSIIEKYDRNELLVSESYPDRGTDPLWARFERSVFNQQDQGEATISRYAIWANTVRDNIIEGMEAMDSGENRKAKNHLIRAANSLSAFADIQAYFEQSKSGERK